MFKNKNQVQVFFINLRQILIILFVFSIGNMIQLADVLVENSIACFIRNGFLIYTVIGPRSGALIYEKDRDLYLTCTLQYTIRHNVCNLL